MDSAVRSVGLDCWYVMVLSALRMSQSTVQEYYNIVPTIYWDFIFPSFLSSEMVSSSGAYCIMVPHLGVLH